MDSFKGKYERVSAEKYEEFLKEQRKEDFMLRKVNYKLRLVSAVLGGYFSLRRLVIQRTKMMELREDLTSVTEEETREFMRCSDHLERLCSIIFPEEADTGEFYLSLEKDPQQEEFLQGRMLGNPYSSKEHGLGPLMREVKNKICMDCELVELLMEHDNGMELLVNNKIISLDLPVKDVYNKVWLPEAGEGEPMRVIYRMRSLLGDTTEEFIESLDKKEGETSDDEEIYRLAEVLGGDVSLRRLVIQQRRRAQEFARLLLFAQVRAVGQPTGNGSIYVREYGVYRTTVLFFALVDLIIREMWEGVPHKPDEEWSVALAEWIRNNDEFILTRSTAILNTFQQDLLPAQDMAEWLKIWLMDVLGLLPALLCLKS